MCSVRPCGREGVNDFLLSAIFFLFLWFWKIFRIFQNFISFFQNLSGCQDILHFVRYFEFFKIQAQNFQNLSTFSKLFIDDSRIHTLNQDKKKIRNVLMILIIQGSLLLGAVQQSIAFCYLPYVKICWTQKGMISGISHESQESLKFVNKSGWVVKNSTFPTDKWRFDKTDLHFSVALSKSNVFLLIYCKFHCQEYMGCPLRRERKQKKKSNFHFQKCPRPLTRECLLTGMCKYRV